MTKSKLVEPGNEDDQVIEVAETAPAVPTEVEIPVTVVGPAQNGWILQWYDAVGRLRQSWSSDRLEISTLSNLDGLPPYGSDLESVLVDICVPVSFQVATLHWMNIWEPEKITYQALRDILASQGAAEYIALEARVQALDAQKA